MTSTQIKVMKRDENGKPVKLEPGTYNVRVTIDEKGTVSNADHALFVVLSVIESVDFD